MKLKNWIKTAVPFVFLGTILIAHDNDNTLTNVPANPKTAGVAVPNALSPQLIEVIAAQGSNRTENSSSLTNYYGYFNDVLSGNSARMLPIPGAPANASGAFEATKTEPDKNTYLVLNRQDGADAHYDYGNHFLFQGHEGVLDGKGYITRINLDADAAHRVTLMATTDVNGKAIPLIDGSAWYPFSERLLFTTEINSPSGGVFQATADYPSRVEDLYGVMGQASYEGIQADSHGNLIIVEDAGGPAGTINKNSKQPNSFIFRFVPYNVSNLKQGGKLQALQVMSKAHSGPIVFHAGAADADIKSQDTKDLRTYGLSFATNWVQLHDTAIQGFAPFDANAAAKATMATPFKRPENGQFRPGFGEFVFAETGDTNLNAEAGSDFGGFGAIFRLKNPGDKPGSLTLLYKGDAVHSSFDNCAFWSADKIVFVEDAGDSLHSARNALDSAYLFDLNTDYSNPKQQPIRILALGRDASSTLDSGFLDAKVAGFQNEGDNEITGFHISDGDPTVRGLIGSDTPTPFRHGWRVFYTQQHGDNVTWEILPSDRDDDHDDH